MSNHLAQIYSTTKNAEKYIVLNSQNVELSGNVKLTNGNLEVSNNLIFNTFSVGDKINFKETNNTTAYNILNDNLTSNNDASFNNIDICGNLNINGGLAINNSFGNDGQVLTSKGNGAVPEWVTRVYAGIQCNNTKNGVSRQAITFTTQVQSGITATSAGFTATSNGWYNLTYNLATISSAQWAYSYIYIMKNGSSYFNSEFRDAGSPWEHDAPHGGGMLIQLNNGDTITFDVEVDVGGNWNVNGYASLIKM